MRSAGCYAKNLLHNLLALYGSVSICSSPLLLFSSSPLLVSSSPLLRLLVILVIILVCVLVLLFYCCSSSSFSSVLFCSLLLCFSLPIPASVSNSLRPPLYGRRACCWQLTRSRSPSNSYVGQCPPTQHVR